jgi:ribosomal protein S18 acetylase RimI-like enzyme
MTVRPIEASELDAFARLGEHPLGPEGLAKAIKEMWDSGESRPAWCFIAEQVGKAVGRVGYTGDDLTPHELGMMALHVPWDGNQAVIGVPLLRESLRQMRAYGWTHIERRVASDSDHAADQRALLEQAGFPLAQEKLTLLRKEPQPLPPVPDRMTFRTLAQSSEEAFVEAYRLSNDDTLDRIDAIERRIMGDAAHARVYIHFVKQADCNPDWWLLANSPDGTLAGLVVAQNFGEGVGCINAIAITPAHRGKGYGTDLILKGTDLLRSGGLTELIADVDKNNAPVIGAFERAGYLPKQETIAVYFAEIDALP